MRVHYRTFGCKANQYDTERMRQEAEAWGAAPTADVASAAVCVVNTCTVTNQADADARRFIRRLRREHPDLRIVVAGCSAALKPESYRDLPGVSTVVAGHDAEQVARAVVRRNRLVQISTRSPGKRAGIGARGPALLRERQGRARAWLKIQDGCDRKCSFCATRLARGTSRSRPASEVIAEARMLAKRHREIVITGIHIGHYGRDLTPRLSLSELAARLVEEVPSVRFRLGSIEATEVDDGLIALLRSSEGRIAPHLHLPLQSGSDAVLRRMQRWHTRAAYRNRTLEIAAGMPVLGLGADVITGFPGETEDDHLATCRLVDELPFTYVHVFPFSPRNGTRAADLPGRVPQRVAGERARELRSLVQEKGRRYRAARLGTRATVLVEGETGAGLTEDYLRVGVPDGGTSGGALQGGILRGNPDALYIEGSGSIGAPAAMGRPTALPHS